MKKIRIISIVFFLLVVLQSGVMSSAWGTVFEVEINKAYYTDIDKDGLEDDVFVKLKFFINYDHDGDIVFRYSITLTLPSGVSYKYYVQITIDDESVVTVDNLFYNHATELGDYKVQISAILLIPIFDTAEASLVFDPPGADDGSPPVFETIVS